MLQERVATSDSVATHFHNEKSFLFRLGQIEIDERAKSSGHKMEARLLDVALAVLTTHL